MLNEKVLDAFLSVGVPEDKARAAAISIAADVSGVHGDIAEMKGDIKTIVSRLNSMQWMMGAHVGLTAGILVKLLMA
jgi:hypothetical protein